MHKLIIGWDVGGAHLKAALLQADGTLLQVLQLPCALWRGLYELEAGIGHVMRAWLPSLSAKEVLHAVTTLLHSLSPPRERGIRWSRVRHSRWRSSS